jgi:hypothetical protein
MLTAGGAMAGALLGLAFATLLRLMRRRNAAAI